MRNTPKKPSVVAFAEPVGVEEDLGSARHVPGQREDEQHGRDQLDEHADAVDPRHELHAEGVDERWRR